MSTGPAARPAAVARRAIRPPVRDVRFWIVQVMVAGLAAAHLAVDVMSAESNAVPAGIPVALLLAPVSYAALRYGLSGSAATALWATVLWLPDLLLPRDEGHVGNDLIELALVMAVAVVLGRHIDAERAERAHAEQASSEHRAAEARYRQLFNTNAAPILVTAPSGAIMDANPAALGLVTGGIVGRQVRDVLGFGPDDMACGVGRVVEITVPAAAAREFRVHTASVPAAVAGEPLTQLVLQDITEERAEGQRVQRFAELLLEVQEEERRRIARELHDEPLQLLVHLARSLERLGTTSQPLAGVTDGLGAARRQTLDIASRLRGVVAGLRPPALEQLGLAAALRGFLADLEDTGGVRTDLRVTGTERRFPPATELAAFRIAQEAVNNAVRHSGCRHLSLSLGFGAAGLCLSITDNGSGFDPSAPGAQLRAGHLGLAGMRERAALAGGHLTIRSSPEHGTRVEATFPGDGSRGPGDGSRGPGDGSRGPGGVAPAV